MFLRRCTLAIGVIIFLVLGCAKKNTPANFENSGNETLSITNEAFKNQVPEEDIEEFRAIQREIGKQFPLQKSYTTRQTGVNPTESQIIAAFQTAYLKYNIPVEILYGIAKEESNLKQFKSNGQPLISGDDGIGILQVTPGAIDIQFDRNSLMWDYQYNIEAGAQVILSKWKYVKSRNPIGNSDYKILENWYFALWAYNGYSTVNNPNEYKNGPKQWCNNSICWTRTKPYQLLAYDYIKDKFGIIITPIPANLLPATGIPAKNQSFQTPSPIHITQYDNDPNFPGSHKNPYKVNTFPYIQSSTTLGKQKKFGSYPPYTQNESGPEEVYQVTITQKGKLNVSLTNDSGADIDIHLLKALDNTQCLARHDTSLIYDIEPGTYYVIADTYNGDSKAGNYTLTMTFDIEGSYNNPYPISTFPYSKASTTLGKESRFNAYPPYSQDESGTEEYYKITASRSGKLTINVTDGSTADVDIHLLSQLDNTKCVARNDSQIIYNVTAGTYYLVVDSYKKLAGNYNLTVTFQ